MMSMASDMLLVTVLDTFFFGIFALIIWGLYRLVRDDSPSARQFFSRKFSSYDRRAFGTPWKDVDRNGRDTRNDILARDLREVVLGANGNVRYGVLLDPYTGAMVEFSDMAPNTVHVDHIVPLSVAWERGADTWTQTQREEFANDPVNLLAVSAEMNQEKSNKTISEWTPENVQFHYVYASLFRAVCEKYGIEMTADEARVVAQMTGELRYA